MSFDFLDVVDGPAQAGALERRTTEPSQTDAPRTLIVGIAAVTTTPATVGSVAGLDPANGRESVPADGVDGPAVLRCWYCQPWSECSPSFRTLKALVSTSGTPIGTEGPRQAGPTAFHCAVAPDAVRVAVLLAKASAFPAQDFQNA